MCLGSLSTFCHHLFPGKHFCDILLATKPKANPQIKLDINYFCFELSPLEELTFTLKESSAVFIYMWWYCICDPSGWGRGGEERGGDKNKRVMRP